MTPKSLCTIILKIFGLFFVKEIVMLFILLLLFGICKPLSAQFTSVSLDITQATVCTPMILFAKYSKANERDKRRFWQAGVGICIKANNYYSGFGFEDIVSREHYHDDISLGSYNGVQGRFGYFIGKEFTYNNDPKHSLDRMLYLGVGSNIKWVYTQNMKVDYEFNNLDLIAQRQYRIQDEKAVILSPFFNSGILMYKNSRLNAEWYNGILCVMKFRSKEISEDYRLIPPTNDIESLTPYSEKEINVYPSFVIGFRLGLFLETEGRRSIK